jgi:t-SNARE complex subunit (syntaxin)
LKRATVSISKKNKEISKSLQDIAEENESRRKEMNDEDSAEMRIRINQHVQVTNKFKDLIGEYQELQEKFKRENKDKQKRAMKIANPKLTEEDTEVIVSSGMDEDQYKKKLGITKSQQGTVNTYFDDAVETRQDVQSIEANLIEVQDLFISMAQLVSTQTELLDNIESSVGIGEEVTRQGLEHVQATKKHQERSRVVTVVIALIIIAVLFVVLLVGGGVTGGVLIAVFTRV